MRFRLTALAGALSLCPPAHAGFDPTATPVSRDGVTATVELPARRHIKNVGGSDGAGLCVFTSLQHAADWQCARALDGFREWTRKRPGGGWPDKVDDALAQFCRERGVALPPYVQHTGGDAEFLETALKTGRFPCVTYAGRDDFYRGRIAHMVNLAHLDAERAAIVDNNRPGSWVWMTRAEFLARWRDMNGGWAVVLLDSPPPPHPVKAPAFGAGPCRCSAACACAPDACPARCPTAFGQCPNGRCPLPSAVPRPPGQVPGSHAGPEPIGAPPSSEHEWRQFDNGVWGWRFKVAGTPGTLSAAVAAENHGVDSAKIHPAPEFTMNGMRVTREQVYAAFGAGKLLDDSSRWHLTAVGDAAFRAQVKADVDALPANVKGKLHVQYYRPDEWPVATFALPAGVSVRKPAVGRKAAETGVVPAAEYTAQKLVDLCPAKKPDPLPPTKHPEPVKPDAPKQPDAPAPKHPDPATPAAAPNGLLALFGAGLLLYFLIRKG